MTQVSNSTKSTTIIDARRDLPATKSLAKLLHSTGVGCPIIAITTEGGLTAMNADW